MKEELTDFWLLIDLLGAKAEITVPGSCCEIGICGMPDLPKPRKGNHYIEVEDGEW